MVADRASDKHHQFLGREERKTLRIDSQPQSIIPKPPTVVNSLDYQSAVSIGIPGRGRKPCACPCQVCHTLHYQIVSQKCRDGHGGNLAEATTDKPIFERRRGPPITSLLSEKLRPQAQRLLLQIILPCSLGLGVSVMVSTREDNIGRIQNLNESHTPRT